MSKGSYKPPNASCRARQKSISAKGPVGRAAKEALAQLEKLQSCVRGGEQGSLVRVIQPLPSSTCPSDALLHHDAQFNTSVINQSGIHAVTRLSLRGLAFALDMPLGLLL